VQGVQAHHQKFWFVENLGKILKCLGKIPENLGRNGSHRCLTSKNGTQHLQKNKWRPFWRWHQKGLNNLCGRKFLGKSHATTFRASLGKFGQKSFAPSKFACSYTYGCAICRNESYTGILNSGYLLSGACRRVAFNKVFYWARFSCISVSLFPQQTNL